MYFHKLKKKTAKTFKAFTGKVLRMQRSWRKFACSV
jgi:hypothetical protein